MLYTKTVGALPVIPQAERLELAKGKPDDHARLLSKQVFAKAVEVWQASQPVVSSQDIKAVAWNIERCNHIQPSVELLASLDADIILLSELDYGMARSGQRHTTAELAATLGYGYVYGVEFLELGVGSPKEVELYSGQTNDVGYHGNAILSRLELKKPGLVRLEQAGEWFGKIKAGDQLRIGGRIAALATIEIGGRDIVFASVHFEDRATPAERGRQMEVLLSCIEEYAPQSPAVIGGDFNTFSFEREMLRGSLEDIRRLLGEDPGRVLHPDRHEPLFAAAKSYGYDWRDCNQLGEPTQRIMSSPLSVRTGKKLDWFFARGLQASAPEVINATPADIEYYLSDHELITTSLQL